MLANNKGDRPDQNMVVQASPINSTFDLLSHDRWYHSKCLSQSISAYIQIEFNSVVESIGGTRWKLTGGVMQAGVQLTGS